MNEILDEMANAFIQAFKEPDGVPLLTKVAKDRRRLEQSGFYGRCEEQERQWKKSIQKERKKQKEDREFLG